MLLQKTCFCRAFKTLQLHEDKGSNPDFFYLLQIFYLHWYSFLVFFPPDLQSHRHDQDKLQLICQSCVQVGNATIIEDPRFLFHSFMFLLICSIDTLEKKIPAACHCFSMITFSSDHLLIGIHGYHGAENI